MSKNGPGGGWAVRGVLGSRPPEAWPLRDSRAQGGAATLGAPPPTGPPRSGRPWEPWLDLTLPGWQGSRGPQRVHPARLPCSATCGARDILARG